MASTTFDITAATGALKELYDGQEVQNEVYKKNPFLAMVKKNEEAGGKYYPVPIIIGASQGRSAKFANAQANVSAPIIDEFLVKRVADYSIGLLSNETLLAMATDKMAFLRGSKVVIDGTMRSAINSTASALFRSGTGSIGQIDPTAGITTGVITLSNAADVVQFELNMKLNAAATDGGAPRAASAYVVFVDRSLGTVTVGATLGGAAATPSGWTNSDYLMVDGDSNAKVSGLAAWIPATAPVSGDNFFGVDRSPDTVRLAGIRFDGRAASIGEALVDSIMLAGREGGEPDICWVSYATYGALEKELGSRVHYNDLRVGEIGFRAIEVGAGGHTVNVMVDRNVQAKQGWLLTMSTWELLSLGPVPHILTYLDTNQMLRVYNADAMELRVGAYLQLACDAPGWNANILFGA